MTKISPQMTNQFNTDGPIFMGAKRDPTNCEVGLFGVPYDGTTCFRPGARFGPNDIREVSNGLETYCPQLNMDLEELNFADLGSLEIPIGAPEPVINEVNKATNYILKLGLRPLMLGGEHSISAGAISAVAKYYPDLVLIQLDAHADLRNEWLGTKHSHACAMKRCLEVLPSKNLIQVGIRSGTKQEFSELYSNKNLITNKSGSLANNLQKILSKYSANHLYITIDLDWFDPSVLPGTGTPEPGGFTWRDFAEIINILRTYKIAGADIVELAPQLDSSKISSILAAKVTRSIIMLLSKN